MTSFKTEKVARDLIEDIWNGKHKPTNDLWKLMEETVMEGDDPWLINKGRIIRHLGLCMICNDGITEATEQLPNESGLYVCYACKIAQREVIP